MIKNQWIKSNTCQTRWKNAVFELQEDLITYVNTRYKIFINCVWRIIVKTQKVSHQFGENLRKRLVYDRQATIKTVVSRHYNCGKLIISIYLLLHDSTKCIQTLKCVINSAQFHIFFTYLTILNLTFYYMKWLLNNVMQKKLMCNRCKCKNIGYQTWLIRICWHVSKLFSHCHY